MGLRAGDTVLDPMMGSGTVLVEATLMGINSIGVDTSPFCRFMTQTKLDTLTMSLTRARKVLDNYKEAFEYFKKKVGKPGVGTKTRKKKATKDAMSVMEPAAKYVTKQDRSKLTKKQRETSDTCNFLLLAYLDSAGYSERSKRKTPLELFKAILERYLFVAEKIQNVLAGAESDLAPSKALEADARDLPIEDKQLPGLLQIGFGEDRFGNQKNNLILLRNLFLHLIAHRQCMTVRSTTFTIRHSSNRLGRTLKTDSLRILTLPGFAPLGLVTYPALVHETATTPPCRALL